MKSRCLIMFVFAIFAAQIAPPMPRWNARAASQSGGQEERGRQGHESKSTALTAIQPAAQTVIPKDGTQPVAPKDKEKNETLTRVTAMPQISITDKNKAFWGYVFDWGPWVFSLALVVIGYFGVRYAKRTLDTIKRQADTMDKQAADGRQASIEAGTLATETLKAIQEQVETMKQQVEVAKENAAAIQKVAEAAKINAGITLAVQRPVVELFLVNFRLGPYPFRLNEPLTDDASVVVTIKNTGLTRAVKVIATGKLTVGNTARDVISPRPYDVRPTGELNITFDPFKLWLDHDFVIAIQQDRVGVQVNLHVAYSDEFGAFHEMEVEAILRNWSQGQWEIRPSAT